jgi:haloalkane dehalogenase
VTPDDPEAGPNRQAWEVLVRYERPFLTLFGDSDAITRGADQIFHRRVPGAEGQPHRTIESAGHFIQEDKGVELAEAMVAFVNRGAG